MAFGHRIIGKKAFTEQQARTVGKAGFGPRVTGKHATTAGTPAPAAPAAPVATTQEAVQESAATGLSIEQFVKMLDGNPAFLDTLYLQELERAEGPRRECLTRCQEVAHELGRMDVVEEIATLPEMQSPVVDAPVTPPATNDAPATPPATAEAERAAKIAEVEKLDNFAALKALCEEMGLDVPVSKAKAREAIIAKLRG